MGKMIHVAYDNIRLPDKRMQNIIGSKRYLDIIYKRKTFLEYTNSLLEKVDFVCNPIILNEKEDLTKLGANITSMSSDVSFLHIFSYARITSPEEFLLVIQKLRYSKTDIEITHDKAPLMLYFANAKTYGAFLKLNDDNTTPTSLQSLGLEQMECEYLCDLSEYTSFITFLSGGFNARYFNSMSGTEFTVTKKSSDKKKIKSEYTFYHLLPHKMQNWFVLPYDYQEGDDWASYTMERYNLVDMAIRWTHHSVTVDEMNMFLKKAFSFIITRTCRTVDKQECHTVRQSLYIDKVKERVGVLKQSREFTTLEAYIRFGTPYQSFDEIISRYLTLYASSLSLTEYLVIGHGDFCFSNTLYSAETMLMRLIDPKGALVEEDLWTDPYYDIAKLSHSICGLYDFFNSGLYEITLDEKLHFKLTVEFDNDAYVRLFKEHLSENGFDYGLTRLYEASLFLSMLPLHIDLPQKVFGFLLNAINIMDEVGNLWKR